MKIFIGFFLLFSAINFLFGCCPPPQKEAPRPRDALEQVRFFYPRFQDDMDVESLVLAIKRNFKYLDRLDPGTIMNYGPHGFTCRQVKESQEAFLGLLMENHDPYQFNRKIEEQFLVYRAAGRAGNNKVLFTGYFEPIFEGSLKPDSTYKYPLYRKPDNLLKIKLSLFNPNFGNKRITARIEGKKVLPYYSRYQIENQNALSGKNLEIAWLKDPIDVAFLHIQGSGKIKLRENKTILVGYHASNGQRYRSIGRYLLDMGVITREKMSMQAIREYLSEHTEMIDEVLNYNPSYVFFRTLEHGPLGNINVPVTPGRSLALDSRLFPKGALAFISCQKPIVNIKGEITEWREFSRFVLNQDTGGAIKGAGRADIFWGSGPYAELAAGHQKHDGDLYILIKKSF